MKKQERQEQSYIKLKLAVCLRKILHENLSAIKTMRQLESSSGLSFTIIQSSCQGERDISFTTLIKIINALGLNLIDFGALYVKTTDTDVQKTKTEIEASKRKRFRATKQLPNIPLEN